jgi:hypothetical protein
MEQKWIQTTQVAYMAIFDAHSRHGLGLERTLHLHNHLCILEYPFRDEIEWSLEEGAEPIIRSEASKKSPTDPWEYRFFIASYTRPPICGDDNSIGL